MQQCETGCRNAVTLLAVSCEPEIVLLDLGFAKNCVDVLRCPLQLRGSSTEGMFVSQTCASVRWDKYDVVRRSTT